MNSRREAKKILKAYGKALYLSRIEYADSFTEDNPSLVCKISHRRLMKRSLAIILVLILTFSLLLIGANAIGIKFLNLSFFEKEDHTEVVAEEKNTDGGEKNHHKFYEPGYIPNGFVLAGKDEFEGVDIVYSYVNKKDEYLTISQNTSDGFSVTIDNEDCEIRQDTIEDMEARIYTYHDTKSLLVLIKKEDIYILISGPITQDEARKIICGLS